MIRLVCNQCGGGGSVMHTVRTASEMCGEVHEDRDMPAVHLHWDCITPWVARRNAEIVAGEEPPF